MPNEIVPGAEFQAFPLEYLIAAPLLAALKAQAAAVEATRMYIERLVDATTRRPLTLDLSLEHKNEAGVVRISEVRAPLLSMVPVPNLRIDSINFHFRYEISQVAKDSRSTGQSIELGARTPGALSPWVEASMRGTMSSQASQEHSTSRSGSVDIQVHASEAPMPEGLARVLTLLTNSLNVGPSAGGQQPTPPRSQ